MQFCVFLLLAYVPSGACLMRLPTLQERKSTGRVLQGLWSGGQGVVLRTICLGSSLQPPMVPSPHQTKLQTLEHSLDNYIHLGKRRQQHDQAQAILRAGSAGRRRLVEEFKVLGTVRYGCELTSAPGVRLDLSLALHCTECGSLTCLTGLQRFLVLPLGVHGPRHPDPEQGSALGPT